jgi:hypothetical protein
MEYLGAQDIHKKQKPEVENLVSDSSEDTF